MNITEKPILRQREVCAVTGMSRSTINRLRKAGRSLSLATTWGVRMMAWSTTDVLAWMESKRVV